MYGYKRSYYMYIIVADFYYCNQNACKTIARITWNRILFIIIFVNISLSALNDDKLIILCDALDSVHFVKYIQGIEYRNIEMDVITNIHCVILVSTTIHHNKQNVRITYMVKVSKYVIRGIWPTYVKSSFIIIIFTQW